jgi:hypothetical protein
MTFWFIPWAEWRVWLPDDRRAVRLAAPTPGMAPASSSWRRPAPFAGVPAVPQVLEDQTPLPNAIHLVIGRLLVCLSLPPTTSLRRSSCELKP